MTLPTSHTNGISHWYDETPDDCHATHACACAQDDDPHTTDADCDLDPTDTCRTCGVYHGDACPRCGGRGFHRTECSATLEVTP